MLINTITISYFIIKFYKVLEVYCQLGLLKLIKLSKKVEIEKVEERGASEACSSLFIYFISINTLINNFLLFIVGLIISFTSIFGRYKR